MNEIFIVNTKKGNQITFKQIPFNLIDYIDIEETDLKVFIIGALDGAYISLKNPKVIEAFVKWYASLLVRKEVEVLFLVDNEKQ